MGGRLLTCERESGVDLRRAARPPAQDPQLNPLLGLQGRIGNAAVARLVREGGPPQLGVQRACACGGKCSDCNKGSLHQGGEEPDELVGRLGVQRACECGGKCGDCKQGALHQGDEDEEGVQREEAKQAQAPTLRMGSRSPFVLELQRLLVSKGAKLEGDGIFGRATLKAVKRFQRGAGLTPDGIVGPKTWHALEGGGPAGAGSATSPQHALVLAKLKTAQEVVKGLKQPAQPQQAAAPQPAASESAGVAFLDEEIEAAEQAVSDIAEGVESGVTNVVETVRDTANDAVDAVVDAATGAAETVGEAASAAADWASDTASNVGGWVSEKAEAAGEWVENEIAKPAEEAVQAVGQAVSDVGSELSGIADDVRKQFGEAFDALDKALEELGKDLQADWDAVSKLLDEFLGGVSPAAAVANNTAQPDPGNGLPPGCQITVEATPLGRDECPMPPGQEEPVDELDEAMGKTGRGVGALFTYDYPRLNMGGTCPISLDGAKLTETVGSDGAVSGKSGVRTGTCPINPDGSIPDCKDTYGICIPRKDALKTMGGRSTATETFKQQLFVQGTLVETHDIKFRFWREGPVVTVTDITRV